MKLLSQETFKRVTFSLIVFGVALGLFSLVNVVSLSMQLNNNLAEQIQQSGEEVNIQSTAEGRGLVAADLERRRLTQERGQMVVSAGIGLVLIGVGWIGYDLLRNRGRVPAAEDQAVSGE